MTVHEHYQRLREEWMETDDDTKLQEFFASDDYRNMSYIERNRGFITGSKLHIFSNDQWWYKLQYVDEMKPPFADDTTIDAFAIGGGFDELVTYGRDAFDRRYTVVQSRVSNVEDAIAEQLQKIEEAQNDLKKDGTRSQPGINAEQKAREKIAQLNNVKGKVQLTQSHMEMIEQLHREFMGNPLMNHAPRKKIIVFRVGKIPVKCELDDYVPNDPLIKEQKHIEANCIRDMKTCASVTNVEPTNWLDQLSLYQLSVEEQTFKGEPVWDGRPTCGMIEAVDKHGYWSRSRCFYYSPARLRDRRGYLLEQISKLWNAQQTGIFYRETKLPAFDCPYYSVEGYGREPNLVDV